MRVFHSLDALVVLLPLVVVDEVIAAVLDALLPDLPVCALVRAFAVSRLPASVVDEHIADAARVRRFELNNETTNCANKCKQ